MTTGRINQVTTFLESTEYSAAKRPPFLGRSSFFLWFNKTSATKTRSPCPPDLTFSRPIAFCLLQQKETVFRGSYQRPANGLFTRSWWIPKCTFFLQKVWPSASGPHSPPALFASHACGLTSLSALIKALVHSKPASPQRRSTIDLAQDKPAKPSFFFLKGILN
jgi:hypothetical protein